MPEKIGNFIKTKNKNDRTAIKAILAGYIAAVIFVMFSFCIGTVSTEETADEKAVEESVSRAGFTYSRPASSLKEIQSDEDEESFTPAPDKLNLAYFFPEDADTSDSINSYAGRIFTDLNTENAGFFASYFDLTDSTPLAVASRYGLGTERVMGRYNPEDTAQDPDDPATWTVNSFRNINVSFYDGDGNRISGYYNVQEIMALASVYAYYHEMDDYDAMEEYCKALFGNAVSARISLGSVYYDSGCLNRTVEQEMNEAIALENEQEQIEGGNSLDVDPETGEYLTIQNTEEISSFEHSYAAANGDLSDVRPAQTDEAGESAETDRYAEQSSAVIYDYLAKDEERNAAASAESSSGELSASDITGASGTASGSSSQDSSASGSTSSGGSSAEGSSSGSESSSYVTVGRFSGSSDPDASQDVSDSSDQDSAAWQRMQENVVVSPGSAAELETESTAEVSESSTIADASSGISSDYIYMNGQAVSASDYSIADSSSTAVSAFAYTDSSAVSGSAVYADSSSTGASLSVYTDSVSADSHMEGTMAAADTGYIYVNGAAAADISENVVVSPADEEGSDEAQAVLSDLPPETSTAAETADMSGNSSANTEETAGTDISSEETEGAESSGYYVTESYCPGHIDLYVSITIRGIDDTNSLFRADTIGNNEENFNAEWQGWTEDKIALAKSLYEQDWLENYGLSISSIRITDSLTEEEIQGYINSLPGDVSEERKAIVRYALESVGKIPYYWGGKPAGPGYDSNSFNRLISPDYRGRILKGLDCSGWINWVYWSVTGSSLAGESTGTLIGCGRKIQRAELKPGDIIIRTGADAHVVMFLCWAQNGNFIGIHETGGVINNVVVSEMTASWPYYRSLTD